MRYPLAFAALTFVATAAVVSIPSPTTDTPPPPAPVRVTVALTDALPYYRQAPPPWCAEDMACWIGSAADGRTDAEIAETLADDLTAASRAYAEE